jgi:hypothetical protein
MLRYFYWVKFCNITNQLERLNSDQFIIVTKAAFETRLLQEATNSNILLSYFRKQH